MKRIKITAILVCFLATLFLTGCVAGPGFYSGVSHFGYGPVISYDYGSFGCGGVIFDNSCGPCGPEMSCSVPCGAVETCSDVCVPSHASIVDCRTSLTNIGNGVRLIGRGVRDMTATPFIVAGKILTSGCRYEVIAHCPRVQVFDSFSCIADSCCTVSTSGCNSCDSGFIDNGFIDHGFINNGFINNGHTQRIQHEISSQSRVISPPVQRSSNSVIQAWHSAPAIQTPHSNSVIQAGHREPITSGNVRFVQPR